MPTKERIISFILAILFIIHGLQLFYLSSTPGAGGLGRESFYIPLVSPLISILVGIALLVIPLVNQISLKKWVLSFVTGRSLLGLVMGIFFLLKGYLSHFSRNPSLEKALFMAWPWILFIFAISFSLVQLKKVGTTRSASIFMIFLITEILFLVSFLFLFDLMSRSNLD